MTGYPFEDDVGHGSQIACIIAASINGRGVQGVAPQARIIAIKVTTGAPAGTSSAGTFIRAIEYAVGLGVDAINLSQVVVFDRRNPGGNGGAEPLGLGRRAAAARKAPRGPRRGRRRRPGEAGRFPAAPRPRRCPRRGAPNGSGRRACNGDI